MCEECETLAKEKVHEEKNGCNCGCVTNGTHVLNEVGVRRTKTGENPSS